MAVVINGTTGISGVDGSAGTPALQGSDPDTGIFYGTNTVSISTNGSTAVTVDANGDTTIANDLIVNGTTTQTGSTTFTAQTLFPDGTVSAPSISNTGDVNTGVYFPAADNVAIATGGVAALTADSSQNVALNSATFSPTSPSTGGNLALTGTVAMGSSFKRNRIINGDMRVDQRNAGASVSVTNAGQYSVDRFAGYGTNAASKFTVQQTPSATETGYATRIAAGFNSYLGATSSSSYTVGASEQFIINQPIEGYNAADLAFGTSAAKTVTISFWAYSSLTGTFAGSLINYGATRSYVFTYSLPVANTWTYITVTIPGDTSATWSSGGASSVTNGGFAYLNFTLGCGSTFQTTAGSWTNGNLKGTSSSVSVVGTSGATFYLTGVQLEVGSIATPYERQIYSDQLAQCQRYYYRVSATSANAVLGPLCQVVPGGTLLRPFFTFPVAPRSLPTGIEYSNIGYDNGSTVTAATTTFFTAATSGAVVSLAGTGFSTSSNYLPVTAGGAGYIGFTGAEL